MASEPPRARRRRFLVPHEVKIFADADPWSVPSVRAAQATVPADPRLLHHLGIEPGSKILFFAGYTGNWAKALAEQAEVHFTDASAGMVRRARLLQEQNPEGTRIRSFRTREASRIPLSKNRFDWSVSFEPFPLYWGGGLPLSLLRSLLNRKGAKIVISNPDNVGFERNVLAVIARAYGASWNKREFDLLVREGPFASGRPEPKSHAVFSLETNDPARHKAMQDLKVLRACRTEGIETLDGLFSEPHVMRLGISREQLLESLRRLNVLGRLVRPDLTKSIGE